jgi:hypothetical protein
MGRKLSFSQKNIARENYFGGAGLPPFFQLPNGICRSRHAAPHLPHPGIARKRAEARLFRRASGECICIGELETLLKKNV